MDKETKQLETPVIFLIFRRPNETARVFEQIRMARPKRLLIVADGPRNSFEKIETDLTRAVVEKIDWQCDVSRNYSDINLGCRQRVWSALDWAFGLVEKSIILEDDCLPDETFFLFCREMLNKYENNSSVMHIGGTNFQKENDEFQTWVKSTDQSYYFSKVAQIWGWATWKRAWKKYDGNLKSWPSTRFDPAFKKIFGNPTAWHYWRFLFDKMYENKFDTWDIAWTYTCFKEKGLCIMPVNNLISNIGFDTAGATHAAKSQSLANMNFESIKFPLKHPNSIEVQANFDTFTFKKVFGINPSFVKNLKLIIKDIIKPSRI